ncbi:MAG: serine hydrolase domain-containing protein [Bacteroidales bacterium]
MGNVSISRNGENIYTKSVGFSDLEKGIPSDRNTKYSIGSISKTFTAVMIFQAIEAGKLSLDETINKYFPSILNADKITLSHLLNHRSGIHNFTADESFSKWQTQSRTKDQMVETIALGGSDFEPGSKAQYSNSNYVLLSYILESAYNKSYEKILSSNITKPLSLRNTYLGKPTLTGLKNESNSYKYFDRWRIELKTNSSITLGAGGILSTSDDINKFMDALFDGKLISEISISTMKTIKENYGMGLFQFPFNTKKGYGHTGGIDGFNSMVIYFPEDKISYAIMSNALSYNFNDIHIAVMSWAYGNDFDLPDFNLTKLTPNDLDLYTGIYSNDQLPIKLTIKKKGDILEAQGTGQPSFPLEAKSKNIFKYTQGGIVIEFDPEKSTLVLKQGGGTFLFHKD